MASEARLKIGAGRLFLGRIAVLAVAMAGIHTARGAVPDLSGFVGVWTLQQGSQAVAACAPMGAAATWDLTGTQISIYPGTRTGTDLTFDIGCHCAVGVNLDGSTATLANPQPCSVVNRNVQVTGDVVLTLQRSDSGVLTWTFSGTGGQLVSASGSCSLSSFSGTGTLARTGTETIDCGDPSTAVGVRTAFAEGRTSCPLGAGAEGVWIETHDEDDAECSDASGSRGEGEWVLPDDDGSHELRCGLSHATNMDFCRVDGARLGPMTTENDPSQFYAVLKLGTTCPNGSIEVPKLIDNEDHPAPNEPATQSIGDLGPAGVNDILTGPPLGTVTKLTFCYFRSGASPENVMPGFPDFGFPYAVFHRFNGEQPPWVIAKRWQHSRDEAGSVDFDPFMLAPRDIVPTFQELIGDVGSHSTTFNMARVR